MAFLGIDFYRHLLRPALFRLPPEGAQKLAELALRQSALWRATSVAPAARDGRLAVDMCGLKLMNPVGLAAGFDKDCRLLPSLSALGFGYLVGGTVTLSPRAGNPRPRMLRRPRDEALVNSLGFPGKGLEHAARRLEAARPALGGVGLVVSVSGTEAEEIVRCHRRLEPLVDALEVNISSPNTAGLQAFHEPAVLKCLIGELNSGRGKPLFVKLPPYPVETESGPADRERAAAPALAKVCVGEGVDGLTVANTRPVSDRRLATGQGGLSGRPILPSTLALVADVRGEVGRGPAINACGGIFTGEDAWLALKAGATTVQLFTGMVYRGPSAVGKMCRELLSAMEREGVAALSSGASGWPL